MSKPYLYANRATTEKPTPKILEMHTHDHYEIFVFYAGNARYHVEGTVYPLNPGDILIMKKLESHSLWINQVVPYDRAVIAFSADAILGDRQPLLQRFLDDRPFGQFNRYPAALSYHKHWNDYIEKMYTHNGDPAYMQIYLTALLNDLYEAYPAMCQQHPQSTEQITSIIAYINNYFTTPLSVETLCKEFYISNTRLNQLFRNMTGAPVWKYIMTKRLLHAKLLLESGESPASACIKSGFNDYSPFYRAYKAHFGVSPKAHSRKASDNLIDKDS